MLYVYYASYIYGFGIVHSTAPAAGWMTVGGHTHKHKCSAALSTSYSQVGVSWRGDVFAHLAVSSYSRSVHILRSLDQYFET